MSQTEIERIAEVIYPTLARLADFNAEGFETWAEANADPFGDFRVDESRNVVRLVLRAIREPRVEHPDCAPYAFTAMIDALFEA